MGQKDMQSQAEAFIEWAKSRPAAEAKAHREAQQKITIEEYEEFKKSFQQGLCYLCRSPLRKFKEDKLCLHWFLKPKSIRKSHFEILIKEQGRVFGFFRLNTYLRWVANLENPIKNINDFNEDPSKLFAETIKYKKLTWSFSCSLNEAQGSDGLGRHDFPHYHLEMRENGMVFIKFNDFHVPFTREDLFAIALQETKDPFIKMYRPYAEGMNNFFNWMGESQENVGSVLKDSASAKRSKDAAIQIDTLMIAPEGKTLSGEDIYDACERAKKEGTTIAYQLERHPKLKEANIRTMISAGEGTPEQRTRTKRQKKR